MRSKENVGDAKAAPSEAGNVWTSTALDADTKLIVITYLVGGRDADCAVGFWTTCAADLPTASSLPRKGIGLTTPPQKANGAFALTVPHQHLVEVPAPKPELTHPVDPLAADVGSEHGTEPVPPNPSRLVAKVNPALKQQVFDVRQT